MSRYPLCLVRIGNPSCFFVSKWLSAGRKWPSLPWIGKEDGWAQPRNAIQWWHEQRSRSPLTLTLTEAPALALGLTPSRLLQGLFFRCLPSLTYPHYSLVPHYALVFFIAFCFIRMILCIYCSLIYLFMPILKWFLLLLYVEWLLYFW